MGKKEHLFYSLVLRSCCSITFSLLILKWHASCFEMVSYKQILCVSPVVNLLTW